MPGCWCWDGEVAKIASQALAAMTPPRTQSPAICAAERWRLLLIGKIIGARWMDEDKMKGYELIFCGWVGGDGDVGGRDSCGVA